LAGADLADLVNEAAIVAGRENGDQMSIQAFTNVVERW
jgi:ATP-dependent Zn protease